MEGFTVSLHYYNLKLGLNTNEVGLKIGERERPATFPISYMGKDMLKCIEKATF